MNTTTHDFRNLFCGMDTPVPTLSGNTVPYVNLDNAASTPALRHVQESVNRFLTFYSSVHRGTGFKSQLSTHAYEESRIQMLKFVGADPQNHLCIFGKNTTEAINKLARRFPFSPERNIVLISQMEHHSNDLPWRAVATVIHVRLLPDGRLDETHFDELLQKYGSRVALVAISGASNVTGYINPIHRLAEKAHAVGAQMMVDCAQLAPHRQIRILPLDDPAHLDYIALSAHKMYAPFGSGALIGRRDIFEQGDPDLRGGGQVEIVTTRQVVWSAPPEREEAGSPNTIGAIAMAAAAAQLEKIGMETVAAHEAELTAYALQRLQTIPGIKIYGDTHPETADQRLGVIPINLLEISHFLVAAVLGYEFGIGVRNGCFCAHPYLLHLLGFSEGEAEQIRQQMISGDRRNAPGMVRISFGLYNSTADVDRLIDALQAIRAGDYTGQYLQNQATGEFLPFGWQTDYKQFFTFQPQ
ncbi:MAG: class V aminotransferase [Bellilinea sp.]|nr:MAG: class V aminotransferase [Bellilinea sp.]